MSRNPPMPRMVSQELLEVGRRPESFYAAFSLVGSSFLPSAAFSIQRSL